MATIVTSPSAVGATSSIDWGHYARVGLATIVAAVLGNVAVYYLGGLVVAYDPRFLPLADVSGAIVCTLPPAVGAALLYAALLRFARRPARAFAIVAAVVFVVATIPDFTLVPTFPGVTGAQTAILVAMHVVAAAIITGSLTGLARPRGR